MKIPDLTLSFLKRSNLPWWIEIHTAAPCCTYYFGPFDSEREAKLSQGGYIEDLNQEKAQGIAIEIKQARPESLTIFDE